MSTMHHLTKFIASSWCKNGIYHHELDEFESESIEQIIKQARPIKRALYITLPKGRETYIIRLRHPFKNKEVRFGTGTKCGQVALRLSRDLTTLIKDKKWLEPEQRVLTNKFHPKAVHAFYSVYGS